MVYEISKCVVKKCKKATPRGEHPCAPRGQRSRHPCLDLLLRCRAEPDLPVGLSHAEPGQVRSRERHHVAPDRPVARTRGFRSDPHEREDHAAAIPSEFGFLPLPRGPPFLALYAPRGLEL